MEEHKNRIGRLCDSAKWVASRYLDKNSQKIKGESQGDGDRLGGTNVEDARHRPGDTPVLCNI